MHSTVWFAFEAMILASLLNEMLTRLRWYRACYRLEDINPKVDLVDFDGTKVIFRYVVDARDCNPMGSLHGGAIATLADNLTTFPAIVDDRFNRAGVSISLEIDYMSAPKPGEVLTIECVADKTGKYLSFSSATFRNSKVRIPYGCLEFNGLFCI